MGKIRYSERFCKLRGFTVDIIEKISDKTGPDGGMEWIVERCLNDDHKCSSFDCKYNNIGIKGGRDPF